MRKQREIINTNIRLNLNNPADQRAWEYLQTMDRKQYRSYSKACVAAINDYFGRLEKLQDDPYLETREKEDAFLQRLNDTVADAIRKATPMLDITGLLKLLQPNAQPVERPSPKRQTKELTDMALDFADSF